MKTQFQFEKELIDIRDNAYHTAYIERYFLNDDEGPKYTFEIDGKLYFNAFELKRWVEENNIVFVYDPYNPDYSLALVSKNKNESKLKVLVDGQGTVKPTV